MNCTKPWKALPGTPVTINTLENALYRTFLNDISFLVANRLIVLAEHQSTINPNMALRMLIYIARLLDGITIGKNLYGKKKIIIPVPECLVLLNGYSAFIAKIREYEGEIARRKRSTKLTNEEKLEAMKKAGRKALKKAAGYGKWKSPEPPLPKERHWILSEK